MSWMKHLDDKWEKDHRTIDDVCSTLSIPEGKYEWSVHWPIYLAIMAKRHVIAAQKVLDNNDIS